MSLPDFMRKPLWVSEPQGPGPGFPDRYPAPPEFYASSAAAVLARGTAKVNDAPCAPADEVAR